MLHENAAPNLDVQTFAQASSSLAGSTALSQFGRVMEACAHDAPGTPVQWQAHGEVRTDALGQSQIWLHLNAEVSVPLTCQRCLDVVQTHLAVERWFRFVRDEAAAVEQDNDCDEDLLVLTGNLDLPGLIEEELVLELPYIARHDVCPVAPPLSAADPDFVAEPERPNPFAALASLKGNDKGRGA